MFPTSCRADQIGTPKADPLVEALRLRAAWLPYPAFQLLAARLLRNLGYTDIHSPGRHSFRGRHRAGGVDLLATEHTEITTRQTIILLKQYTKSFNVPRYFVDALRGTMLRLDVPHAVVLATVSFSPQAHEAAESYAGRPIDLFDGRKLGQMMLEQRVGVIERRNIATGEVRLEFDESLFELLERFAGRSRSKGVGR